MKKLLTLTVILYSLMFSSVSFGEWTAVARSPSGLVFYVDFDRIRKNNGYVYFWRLGDYPEPIGGKHNSVKSYHKVDCELFRHQYLVQNFYNQSMGKGDLSETYDIENPSWAYPPPNSATEVLLEEICK
jgi:hypothetical protein